jgi:hypothetical protein
MLILSSACEDDATPPPLTTSTHATVASGPVAVPARVPSPIEVLRHELAKEAEDRAWGNVTVLSGDVAISMESSGTLSGTKATWVGKVPKGTKVIVDGKRVKVQPTGVFRIRVKEVGPQDYESVVVARQGDKRGEVRIRAHRALSDYERGERFLAGSPDPTYKQLEKDPDAFRGTRVKFRGRIFNIREGSDGAAIQMHVGLGYFGYTSNNLMVFYPNRTSFVRGNVISVYGTVLGAHSYQSQAGWRITVPAVLARYLVP